MLCYLNLTLAFEEKNQIEYDQRYEIAIGIQIANSRFMYWKTKKKQTKIKTTAGENKLCSHANKYESHTSLKYKFW